MLPGPVFNAELITTARRGRYYAARVLYGAILLFVIGLTYESHFGRFRGQDGTVPIERMAGFSASVFVALGVVQGVTVLALTPALVAGVIADEVRRKTLHYLLASRLSGPEIVLGKLLARLLHVAVFLALGLPVLSLMSLFGGVDPLALVATFAATASTALFLAGLSLLASVVARRPRDAVALAYLLEAAWLFVPPVLWPILRFGWPAAWPWLGPPLMWILASNPISMLEMGPAGPFGAGAVTLVERALWLIGLQLAAGLALVALAVVLLRPMYRAREGGGWRSWLRPRLRRRGATGGARRRLRTRPGCGDDPMMWKERHVARLGRLVRVVGGLLATVLGGLAAWGVYWFGSRALAELWAHGFGSDSYSDRMSFNIYLRFIGCAVYVFWGLAVGALAAGGVTGEREADTWISLVATPLEGPEILRAKMAGAAWVARPLAYALVVLWGAGLLTGSIHPLGLVAALGALAVFSAFAAALGTYVSLRSNSTLKAQALTVGILVFLNVGYLFCCIPLQPETMMVLAPCSPWVMWVAPLSYADLDRLLGGGSDRAPYVLREEAAEASGAFVVSLILYAVGALVLAIQAFEGFDRAVDRPSLEDRPGRLPPPYRRPRGP